MPVEEKMLSRVSPERPREVHGDKIQFAHVFRDIPQTNETRSADSSFAREASFAKNSTSTMRVLALAAALCAVSAFAPIHSRATRAAVAVRVIKVDVEVDWDAIKGGVEKGVGAAGAAAHRASKTEDPITAAKESLQATIADVKALPAATRRRVEAGCRRVEAWGRGEWHNWVARIG